MASEAALRRAAAFGCGWLGGIVAGWREMRRKDVRKPRGVTDGVSGRLEGGIGGRCQSPNK